MKEVLDEVLIKIQGSGRSDMVLYIENLPKEILYYRDYELVPEVNRDGQNTGGLVPDKNKPKAWRLKGGLVHSQTKDKSIILQMSHPEAKEVQSALNSYIQANLTPGTPVPKPVPYAQDPSDTRSLPIPLDQIPRVRLPALTPPASQEVESEAPEQNSEEATDQDKLQAMRERAAKARAARAAKAGK